MNSEAKLGLVFGVTLVVVVAVVFFRKDIVSATVPADSMAPGQSGTRQGDSQGTTQVRQQLTLHDDSRAPATARRHTVKAGETLFTLAEMYYRDGERFIDIYRANRDVLKSPDALAPGMELLIPVVEP
jgi:nucleoid-associated protein YgaU